MSGVRGQIRVFPDRSGIRTATRTRAEDPISHVHARTLALLWQDPDRPDFAITVLARTGAIPSGADTQLQHDLTALSGAAHLSSDPGTTICEAQIEALLTYVRVHGRRGPVAGWATLPDDGEFVEATQEFARARRPQLSDTPAALPLTLATPTATTPTPTTPTAATPTATGVPLASPAPQGPAGPAPGPRPVRDAVPAQAPAHDAHDDADHDPDDDPHVTVLSDLRTALTDRGADPAVIDRVVSAVLELVDAVVGATRHHRERVPVHAGDAVT